MDRKQIWDTLENKILPLVQKPGRYIGGEGNSVYKDLDSVNVRVALVFPDVYEVGMSNLGLKILYEEINSRNGFYAERFFSPWVDMEEYMRKYKIPPFSLETHSPLNEFDIIGFSLQYELCYTNVLNMLNLAGIPLRATERIEDNYPIVSAGGLMAYTPEPIAPFIDFFIVGDGEEAFVRVLEFYNDYFRSGLRQGGTKEKFLEEIAKKMDCIYVPILYDALPDKKGRLTNLKPKNNNIPKRIKKNVLKNLNSPYLPVKPVTPLIEVVHDRVAIEIMRGCPRRCRFCQAGVLYSPVRKRDIKDILDCAYRCIENTGYGEIGLLSLSSTDYGGISELVDKLLEKYSDRRVSISLPSMRVDSFSLELVERISKVKKTGITLAPEAASSRLLDIINKGYKPQDVINIAKQAYSLGYRLIKLYFMIGLPGEDFSDLDELINLLYMINKIGFLQINVSVSTMIPKAHTAFQKMGMVSIEKIKEKQEYIRKGVKKKSIRLKFHNPYLSLLEAVFGRGDRRLADVIKHAWEMGSRFDQWEECFKFNYWEEAFNKCGINLDDYLVGWGSNESLPWDHIDIGLEKKFLEEEVDKVLKVLNCMEV